MLCSFCADWWIEPANLFCGGCGAFVAEVTIEFTARATESLPLHCVAIGCEPGAEAEQVQFGIFLNGPEGEREIARAHPNEYPDPMLLPGGAGEDQALRVRALRDNGAGPPAPNAVAVHVLRRSAEPHVVHLRDALIDCAAAVPAAPGWRRIGIALDNAGAPLVVTRARLRIDGAIEGEADPPEGLPGDPPVLAASGAAVHVGALLSDGEFDALRANSRLRTGRIDLTIGGPPDPPVVTVVQRARLFIARPPGFEVALARKIRGREGHRARIGAVLDNIGGAPLRVTGLDIALDGEPLDVALPLAWRAPILPGEAVHAELRPSLAGVGKKRLTLSVRAEPHDGTQPIDAGAVREIEIARADHVFPGAICIDFGTGESGAAAIHPKSNQPFVVDLGCVPIETDAARQGAGDRTGRFLPTLVAEMHDGSYRVGDEVARFVAAERIVEEGGLWPDDLERPVELVQDFKWLLDSQQADGGERGQRLATAYLRTVRELIENHPEVAGAIGEATRVYATRPTVFDGGQSERLCAAFAGAGLGDPRATLFSGKSLIAESWAPLPILLQPEDADLAQNQEMMRPLDEGIEIKSLPGPRSAERARASAWLIVCDIGAGSADFSVIEIAPPPRGTLQKLHERASATDTGFTGRQFTALIERALIEWAAGEARRIGLRHDEKAIRDAIGAGSPGNSPAAKRLREAVRKIQFNPGLLAAGDFPLFMEAQFANLSNIRKDLARNDHDDGGSFDQHFDAFLAAVAGEFAHGTETRRAALEFLPLELDLPGGAMIVLDANNIGDFVRSLVAIFMRRYFRSLPALIDRLIEQSGLRAYLDGRKTADAPPPAGLVRIIPSGRGAAFPLANALIRAATNAISRGGASYGDLSPVASKSITSWGALKLAGTIEDRYSNYRIEATRRLEPQVEVGRDINNQPEVLAFAPVTLTIDEPDGARTRKTSVSGAVLAMAEVADRHFALDEVDELLVAECAESGAPVHRIGLPGHVAADPDQWWLCALNDGAFKLSLIRAASGEQAFRDFHALEKIA